MYSRAMLGIMDACEECGVALRVDGDAPDGVELWVKKSDLIDVIKKINKA